MMNLMGLGILPVLPEIFAKVPSFGNTALLKNGYLSNNE